MKNIERIKQIAIVITFMALIVTNFLATPFSGTQQTTVEEVFEESLSVLINPAPFAIVAIWFFAIFPGLGAFSVFQARASQRENPLLRSIRGIVIVNFIMSSLWVLGVQARNDLLVNIVGIGLLVTALVVVVIVGDQKRELSKGEHWCVQIPFSIYLAWLSVATIVSIAGALDNVGWDGFGLSAVTWTVIMMTVAAVLGAVFLIVRRDIPFAGVILYALTAIMLAQPERNAITLAWFLLSAALLAAIIVWSRLWERNAQPADGSALRVR